MLLKNTPTACDFKTFFFYNLLQRVTMIKLITLVFSGLIAQVLLTVAQPTVRVEQGTIVGKTVHFENEYLGIQKDFNLFLSIPYAEPPIGDRRFAAPLPKEPWDDDDIYNATAFRDICVQSDGGMSFPMSEDCLYLNVYAPNPAPVDAAVMVYIHGGSYTSGNGYDYNGTPQSAIGDVIVVTMNYRLSTFGFFTTGDEASPGNYGMLDQLEAMKWVKKNIQAFGGDADKITLFGESAGAGSVSAHLFSPLSRDLFHQAILESGSVTAPWSFHYDLEVERDIAFKFGEAVGCPATTTQDLMACLRQVDAQVINIAAQLMMYWAAPCVDNYFLLEPPTVSLEKNNYKKCPLINGFNKDEGTFNILVTAFGYPYINSSEAPFVSEETFDTELSVLVSTLGPALIGDSIKQQYVDWSITDDPEADYFDPWKNYAGDLWFSCPSVLESRYHAMAAESNVYQYHFTHVPSISFAQNETYGPKWLQAGHGEDIPFVFGYPFIAPDQFKFYDYPEEEMELSLELIKYWTNFAKTGNPNKESDSSTPYEDDRAWPAFTIPELQYKELAVNLTEGRGLRADACHFWNEYLPKLTTFSADLEKAEREWREEFYKWKYTDMEDWRGAFEEYQHILKNL